MHKSAFIIMFIFLIAASVKSQTAYFNKTYDFFGDPEVAWNVVEINSGYLIVGGVYKIDNSYLLGRIGVMLVDASGNTVWKKSYGRSLHNYYPGWGGSFAPTNDGGYALAGSVADTTGNDDVTLFKFNNKGDSVWSKTFDYSNFDYGSQCKQTPDSGFIISGGTKISGLVEFMLIKTDSLGNQQWMKRYPSSDGYGRTVALCNDGGYLIGGNRIIAGNSDAHIVKTDSIGNEQWKRSFGGPGADGVAIVQATGDGGYIIGTDSSHYMLGPNSYTQFRVIKLDSAGNTIWNRFYGPVSWGSNIWMIRELNDGSFIVAGNYLNDIEGLKGVILNINPSGDSLWWREYQYCENQGTQHYFRDVIQTKDNGYLACGFVIDGYCDSNQNMWVMKFDSMGCNEPNCYVGINSNIDAGHLNVSVYPNPFSTHTTILVQNVDGSEKLKNATIELYDVMGRKREMTGTVIHNASYVKEIKLERGDLSPGLYFYTLEHKSEIIASGKLIVQ